MRTHLLHALRVTSVDDGVLADAVSIVGGRISGLSELWRDDIVLIEGTATVSGLAEVSLAGLTVKIGRPDTFRTEVPFSLELPALPVALGLTGLMLREGLVSVEQLLDIAVRLAPGAIDPAQPPSPATLADIVGGLSTASLSLGPVPVRLAMVGDQLIPARPVRDATGNVIGLEPDIGAPPPELLLGSVTLSLDLKNIASTPEITMSPVLGGFDLKPVLIADTPLGFDFADIQLHTVGSTLPSGIDPASVGPNWWGVSIGRVRVYGLAEMAPCLQPGTVLEAFDWVLDSRGMTGHVAVTGPAAGALARFDAVGIERIALGFTRSPLPSALSVEGTLDPGRVIGGSSGLLSWGFDLSIAPSPADPSQRWEAHAEVTSSDDEALIGVSQPDQIAPAAAALAVLLGDGDLALILAGIQALTSTRVIDAEVERIAVRQLRVAVGPTVSTTGDSAVLVTVSTDLEVVLTLEGLPGVDDPVMIGMAGMATVSVASGSGAIAVSSTWSLGDGLSVTLPAPVDVAGLVSLREVTLRRDEQGRLLIELGVGPGGESEVSLAPLPGVVVLVVDPTQGTVEVRVERGNQPVSLLIPGVLFATGWLSRDPAATLGVPGDWGEVLRGRLQAFLIGNGSASTLKEHQERHRWMFDLEVELLSATRGSDGLQALVVSLAAGFRPGLPLGASGTSLYGLGLTFAQNGRPAVGDGDLTDWFLEVDQRFSTGAAKWQPEADAWGFGAAATLGSQPDNGRAWNATLGLFLLLPGPVIMLTGRGNLFTPPAQLPATGGDPASVTAPFGAVIVLDFDVGKFDAELRADIDVMAGDTSLARFKIPASVGVDLSDPRMFHLHLGRNQPESDRVQGRALDFLDISGYLMVDGRGITLAPGMQLPGVALAYGASGGIDWDASAGPLRLHLWAEAGFDLGIAVAAPPLLAGRIYAEGGLEATAFGVGIALTVGVDFAAVAPDPFTLDGSARVQMSLPWPIPDLNASVSLRLGDRLDEWHEKLPPPSPETLFEEVVAYDPRTGSRVVLPEHGSAEDASVQVDAGLIVSFAAPVGNQELLIGTTTVHGRDQADGDLSGAVLQVTASDDDSTLGYRHVLERVALVDESDSDVTMSGIWPKGTEAGNGGASSAIPRTTGEQAARTSLQLLDVGAQEIFRRVGLGGELTARALAGITPCTPPPVLDEKARFRRHTAKSLQQLIGGITVVDVGLGSSAPRPLPDNLTDLLADFPGFSFGDDDLAERLFHTQAAVLGPSARHRLPDETPVDGHPAWVTVTAPIPGSATLARQLGARLVPPGVQHNPLQREHREVPIEPDTPVLTVPALVWRGSPSPGRDSLLKHGIAGWLGFELPQSQAVRIMCLAPPDAIVVVRATLEDGRVVNRLTGATTNLDEALSMTEVTIDDAVKHIKVAAASAEDQPSVCVVAVHTLAPIPPVVAHHERNVTAAASMAADLLERGHGWSHGLPEGMLAAAAGYTLEVTVRSFKARLTRDRVETHGTGTTATRRWQLRTKDQPPQRLEPKRSTGSDASPGSRWEIATAPTDGQPSHLRAEPLTLQFRDARTLAMLAAHNREPRLRLVDARGWDQGRVAGRLAQQAAAELDPAEAAVRSWLAKERCVVDPSSPDELFSAAELTADVASLLEPGMRYEVRLHASPRADASTRWNDTHIVHRWQFTASRWLTFEDQVQAMRVEQRILMHEDPAQVLSQLRNRVSPAAEPIEDPVVLDALLHDLVGLAPEAPPEEARLELLWGFNPDTGVAQVLGVLAVGPERIARDGLRLRLIDGSGPVPAGSYTDSSGAAVLIVAHRDLVVGPPLQVVFDRDLTTIVRELELQAEPMVLQSGSP